MDDVKEKISETIEKTEEVAEEIVRHPWTKKLARIGFYSKGFLFIVIGILAIFVALGFKDGRLADPTGAMAALAQSSPGRVLLVFFIIGAIGHGIWNILRGAADVDDAGGDALGIAKRALAIGIGFFYFWLAWSAWSIISATQTVVENGKLQKTFTAILLALPFGAVLVLLIGLGTIGAGFQQCYMGISGKFRENYKSNVPEDGNDRIITFLGVLSFTARAVILGLIGYYFISAAVNYNANEAIGMDGALLTLAQSYYGKTLLFVAAAGLVCHGILSLYEAKYRRLC